MDFEKRKEVGRIELPDAPIKPAQAPAYGIVVSPDGKTLWIVSDVNSHLYAYSLPDLKLLGGVPVGRNPHWLTLTPDGKTVYVANAGANSVSVIAAASRKEVARIKVGQVPKRNIAVAVSREKSSMKMREADSPPGEADSPCLRKESYKPVQAYGFVNGRRENEFSATSI